MTRGKTDITLPFRGGLSLRIVTHPGRWMKASDRDALVADLHAVADDATPGGPLRYGVLAGTRRALKAAVLCVAYERGSGTPVAFSAATLLGGAGSGRDTVLHIGLCIIRKAYRSRGLCLAISAAGPLAVFLRGGLRPLWVTNVTQVPAAAGLFASMVEQVYPAPGLAAPPTPEHLRVAQALMGRRDVCGVGPDADFDRDAFVIRNAYTGGSDGLKKSYAECASHRDGAFGRFCLRRLDYLRGDDLLQVGRLTVAHAVRAVGQVVLRATGLRRLASILTPGRSARPAVATSHNVS
ncbi:MAG: hypothetical protein JSU98_08845 [Gemmatimonadales bacterium]|nr:MAG: hypothetical protein JSU98_08845 [Gemmatimonadales bacterium]